MRSLNTVALFVGMAALVGCSDDSSISGVYPSSGYLGRTVRVEVSGDNASWENGVALDFGPGVTVGPITVASPTSLFAEITIADGANPGLRDVVVRSGSDQLTLSQAFKLDSPLAMQFNGKLAQGSIVNFTARNLDFFAPFDATCGASFFGMCLLYTNMKVNTPDGVNAVVNAVEAYTVSGTLYVDLDATSGPISLVSGPEDKVEEQVISPVGTNTEFAARTAVALNAGSPTTTTVEASFDSHLYEFQSSGTGLSRFSISTTEADADPVVYLLPESGSFLDMITASAKPNAISMNGEKFYAIYVDNTGLSGYSYGIRVNPLPLIMVPETDAANNTSANPQNVNTNSTVLLANATIASDTDQDWIRFTVPAGSSAKKVHVITAGGDPQTDTMVEIYKDSEAPANLIGEAEDSNYHEDVLSTALGTAQVVFVKITGSAGYFNPAHSAYVAAIFLE